MAEEGKQDSDSTLEEENRTLRVQLAARGTAPAATAPTAAATPAEPAGDTSTPNRSPPRRGAAGEKAEFREQRYAARKDFDALAQEFDSGAERSVRLKGCYGRCEN